MCAGDGNRKDMSKSRGHTGGWCVSCRPACSPSLSGFYLLAQSWTSGATVNCVPLCSLFCPVSPCRSGSPLSHPVSTPGRASQIWCNPPTLSASGVRPERLATGGCTKTQDALPTPPTHMLCTYIWVFSSNPVQGQRACPFRIYQALPLLRVSTVGWNTPP